MAMDVLRDARTYTTPLGAIAGLVLARQLVAKKDRNVFNQGAGAAAGAAAGYIGGGYLQDHLDAPKVGDTAGHMALGGKRFEAAGPDNREPLNEKDYEFTYNSLPKSHHLPESGINNELQDVYLERMGAEIRAARAKHLAAADPKSKWNASAAHWQGVADKAKGRMAGINSPFAHMKALAKDWVGRGEPK